jgi:hypothetical protein
MKLRHFQISLFISSTLILFSCGGSGSGPDSETVALNRLPAIFPDYSDICIPSNIAPLNFQVLEEGETFIALFEGSQGHSIKLKAKNNTFRIPSARWSSFIKAHKGSQISLTIFKKEADEWMVYEPIHMEVAEEEIDPYLVYRLIPPGYETWSRMGLYQRDLTSFRESPLIENKYVDNNCVNCHSFSLGSSENMLFHIRGSLGGTMIKRGNSIEKVDLNREETLSAGVYPSLHPSGDYIAFSTNKIEQYFHAGPEKSIEVLDRQSDLILYEVSSKEIIHVPGTRGDRYMETYPTWSPEGNYLFFSRSDADAQTPFDSIRYDIYRISFNPESKEFGEAELVYPASEQGQSASFPRVSPEGKYLLFTIHDYGTFPIWHKEADLCLLDLDSGEAVLPGKLNSDDTDSYHSWSSNGRWVIFSSRRYDGRYTLPYISYLNPEGQFQKAFLLPQKDPRSNASFFYSYNRPELIDGPIRVKPRQWIRKARSN